MAFAIGSFKAVLGIDTGDYTRGILNANAITSVFGQTATNFLVNPLLAGADAMVKLGSVIASEVSRLGKLSQSMELLATQTGLTTQMIESLKLLMDTSPVGGDAAIRAIEQLVIRLGNAREQGGEMAQTLHDMGIGAAEFANSETAIRSVFDALAKIEDPMLRASMAMKLMGREGPALAAALRDGSRSIDDAIERYTKLGSVMGEQTVKSFSQLEAATDAAKQAFNGIKQSAVVALMQSLGIETDNLADQIYRVAGGASQAVASGIPQAIAFIRTEIRELLKDLGFILEIFNPAVSGAKQVWEAIRPIRDVVAEIGEWLLRIVGLLNDLRKGTVGVLGNVIERGQNALSGDGRLSASQLAMPGYQEVPGYAGVRASR